jgi:hypothetical protein
MRLRFDSVYLTLRRGVFLSTKQLSAYQEDWCDIQLLRVKNCMKSDIIHLNKHVLQLRRVDQNLHVSFTKLNRLIVLICRPAVRHHLTLTVKERRFFDPLGTNPKETWILSNTIVETSEFSIYIWFVRNWLSPHESRLNLILGKNQRM